MARFCGGATQSHPIENTAASLLSFLLGGPVLAWVRTVYTRLSGTNDRNFLVTANETAADMLCCTLYPRIQTFPSTDLHRHGGGPRLKRCRRAHDPKEHVRRTIVSLKL